MTKSSKPSKESQGLSVMTEKRVKKIDISISAKTESPRKSVRSKADQVSERRFDPTQFDSTCQTDEKLMEIYFKKPQTSQEIFTEPVVIKTPKNLRSFMIQTEPEIEETKREYDPIPIEQPVLPTLISSSQVLSSLSAEPMVTLDMPMPQEPEDVDWAYSPLFKFVKDEWLKNLARKDKITLADSERPRTPDDMLGMKP